MVVHLGLFFPRMVGLSCACLWFPHLVVTVSKLTLVLFSGYDWVFVYLIIVLLFFGNVVTVHLQLIHFHTFNPFLSLFALFKQCFRVGL